MRQSGIENLIPDIPCCMVSSALFIDGFNIFARFAAMAVWNASLLIASSIALRRAWGSCVIKPFVSRVGLVTSDLCLPSKLARIRLVKGGREEGREVLGGIFFESLRSID